MWYGTDGQIKDIGAPVNDGYEVYKATVKRRNSTTTYGEGESRPVPEDLTLDRGSNYEVTYFIRPVKNLKVTYQWLGAPAGAALPEDDTTYAKNARVTVDDAYTDGQTLQVGTDEYTFHGWYKNNEYEGDPVTSFTITLPTTLYGYWAKTDAKKLEIKAASGTKVYDGTALTNNAYTVSYAGQELTKGTDGYYTANRIQFKLNDDVNVTGAQTDAGKSDNTISGTKEIVYKDTGATAATFKNVAWVNGTLTVTKRNVTITSANLSKEYDGKALTNGNTALATESGWVDGEGASYTFTGSQKAVGSSANAFSYTLNNNTKAGNYVITKTEGTLTVTNRDAKYEITVTAKSATEKYDGTEKSVSGLVTTTFTVEGNTYTVSGLTASAKGTDAGIYTSAVTGTAVVKDSDGNNVTAQFSVKTENGTLTVTKRNATITSESAEKQYDGTALTKHEVKVTGDGFVEGQGADYSYTGSQTLVGSSENFFSYTLKEGTKADNYNITTGNGTLTVTNREAKYEITVEANGGSYKYDGTEKSVSGLKETTFTVEGSKYTVSGLTAEAKGTDAGSYPVNVTGTATVKDAAGNDVTAQFSVKTVNGTLTVTKRDVTITSGSATKQYDGKALTKHGVEVTGDGFVDGQGADYSYTGSQTLVGSSANSFTYTLKDGTKADNYVITTANGTLTVTDRDALYSIEVEANSGSYKYDGTEKSVSGLKETTFTVEGNTYTISGLTAEAKATDAGSYTVNVTGTATVKDAEDHDVTSQFAVITKPGTLTVTKRDVTITSGSATKQYDGKALTKHEVKVTGDGFVDGQGADYSYTGSQTLVGSSANAFSYTLNSNTKADNYVITKTEGTLTVTDNGGSGGGGGGGGGTTYYILQYESNGGTSYKDERYTSGATVKLDKVPTREGYAFTGWYADEALTEKITNVRMNSARTVYAGWNASIVPDMLNGDDHFAYVIGCSDGLVRPTANISRAEVATIFFRLLKDDIRDENLTSYNIFDDVTEGMWCNKSISTMAKLGIVKGRSTNRFDPNANITRAEFAAICARFDTGLTNGDSNFTDISGHWAEAEIKRAASLGWIRGCTDGSFCPDTYITRAEAMTMINRVLCRILENEDDLLHGMNVWPDNQPGAWYYLAVQEATNSHDFKHKGEMRPGPS